jgi:hypothetical protein
MKKVSVLKRFDDILDAASELKEFEKPAVILWRNDELEEYSVGVINVKELLDKITDIEFDYGKSVLKASSILLDGLLLMAEDRSSNLSFDSVCPYTDPEVLPQEITINGNRFKLTPID